MKAFILAAGLGERLRPLTDGTPKCLLPICGKPLLEIWLDLLTKHSIAQVIINKHWLPEKVDEFLELYNNKNISIQSIYEPELLGSAGTIYKNKDFVDDGNPFFILYGDNLTNVNLSKMYSFHNKHNMPFTLGVFETDKPEKCGIADVDNDGNVKDFIEKPKTPISNLAAAGIYIADKRIFNFFPKEFESTKQLDLGFHIIPNLIGQMKAYKINELLLDIGDFESYKKAQFIIE